MFETFDYLTLQQYWWILVAILGSGLIFTMFTLGGQSIFRHLWKTEEEKDLILNAVWKHYKFTFSVFVTFGWAVFASFPIFYATSFGWAYLVWMAILFLMIVQAVAYHYRKKEWNFLGQKTYDVFLFLNWFLVPLLLWVAVATFFTGSNFVIEQSNLVNSAWESIHITAWTTPFYGLEALWNTREWAFITNIALWIALTFLVRILAILYVINHVDDKKILENTKKCLAVNTGIFLVAFLTFVFKIMFMTWFAYWADWKVVEEAYKYFHNLLENGIVFGMFVLGTISVLVWIGLGFAKSKNWFWIAWAWVFAVVFSVFMLAGLFNTPFYPSIADLQSSLTIENASSSQYSLTVMAYVSLIIPFVLAYIIWAWNAIAWKPMSKEDLKNELEAY